MIYVMYVQDSINIFFNPGHEIMGKWRECRSITRFYNFCFCFRHEINQLQF